MKVSVQLDDGSAVLEFVDCVAYTQGDIAGNIDCSVHCGPELSIEEIAAHLKLRVPGDTELADVVGSGSIHGGYDLTFYVQSVDGAKNPPGQVEPVWVDPGMQSLGRLACVTGD